MLRLAENPVFERYTREYFCLLSLNFHASPPRKASLPMCDEVLSKQRYFGSTRPQRQSSLNTPDIVQKTPQLGRPIYTKPRRNLGSQGSIKRYSLGLLLIVPPCPSSCQPGCCTEYCVPDGATPFLHYTLSQCPIA